MKTKGLQFQKNRKVNVTDDEDGYEDIKPGDDLPEDEDSDEGVKPGDDLPEDEDSDEGAKPGGENLPK